MAALSACSPPPGQPRQSFRPQPGTDEYKTWLAARVEADTANLSIDDVEIDRANKLPKLMSPAEALKNLSPLTAMSKDYELVFQAYNKKFQKLLEGVKLSTKAGGALKGLAGSLNIDMARKPLDGLSELLARFRALDMIRAPVE